MTEKICLCCNTENPPHFEYCKHCGAPLPVVDRLPNDDITHTDPPSFDEVSYCEYYQYIGNGARGILEDFNSLKTSRVVFSLPVLFLGLFFGFFGMSAWFFYRKLKKAGTVLLLIGLALIAVEALINAPLIKSLVDYICSLPFDDSLTLNIESALASFAYSYTGIAGYIEFVSSFFVSAFALRIYKNDSYKRILSIKSSVAPDSPVSAHFLLKSSGGTSIGLAFVPFLVSLVATAVAFWVCVI